ncbi:uncharacterized protein IL334_005128 [Kwoniella shivajii]|uniref:Uncharacterized protein n=1 Tax=Kwoniella shivajii TaxID=564305 RepID=A0ABZ1D2A3_9TREE|nr:hypothetical protein IL334_005128 [Kwoniella shivajii]
MNEPMDIDLPLDEIIAKKRTEQRASKRIDRKINPYSRPQPITKQVVPSTAAIRDVKSGMSLSNLPIKTTYNVQSFPSVANPPLNPTPRNLERPCRELSAGIFSKDVTPAQIRDLIQSTVGPVQELRLDDKGIAWIRMLRWQGWEVYTFLNGEISDGTRRITVRVYPLPRIPLGSIGANYNRRKAR